MMEHALSINLMHFSVFSFKLLIAVCFLKLDDMNYFLGSRYFKFNELHGYTFTNFQS